MRIRPVKPGDAAAINRINENVQTQNIFSNIASHQ